MITTFFPFVFKKLKLKHFDSGNGSEPVGVTPISAGRNEIQHPIAECETKSPYPIDTALAALKLWLFVWCMES